MAHFAELDNENIVQRVIVISNDDLIDADGIEKESLGIKVCKDIFGSNTKWVQTSYNGNKRRKYAAIGDKYDKTADVFYNPNPPFPSWSLDSDLNWQPPTSIPEDGKHYYWDEPTLSWVEVVATEEK